MAKKFEIIGEYSGDKSIVSEEELIGLIKDDDDDHVEIIQQDLALIRNCKIGETVNLNYWAAKRLG